MSQEQWSEVSRELEREWSSIPLSHSHPWEEIEDDVRFGWEQALSPEFEGAEWDDVRDLLQQRWEGMHPHPGYEDWRVVSEAVRLGFIRAKEMVG